MDIEELLNEVNENNSKEVLSFSNPGFEEDSSPRENLSILVASGKCKEMIGQELSQDDVKKLSEEVVKKLNKRYEVAISSRTTEALTDSLLKFTCKVVGMVLDIDSVEELQKDLLGDYIINQELRTTCGWLSIKYGRLMALASGALLVARHMTIRIKEPEAEVDKVLD